VSVVRLGPGPPHIRISAWISWFFGGNARLGLKHRAHSLAHLAHAVVEVLLQELDLGKGKSVYQSYLKCIECNFAPFFAYKPIEALTLKDIAAIEIWRNQQMGKQPKTSTLNNLASPWNHLIDTAVERGWVSAELPPLAYPPLAIKVNHV